MSPFEQVLRIAQEQLAAVARGDLTAATDRLDERGALLLAAPAAQLADQDTIEEIMRLDRVLSGAIRERMVAIRNEALEGQRGRVALDGYSHAPASRPRVLDAVG
jgi:hypothetical protein